MTIGLTPQERQRLIASGVIKIAPAQTTTKQREAQLYYQANREKLKTQAKERMRKFREAKRNETAPNS